MLPLLPAPQREVVKCAIVSDIALYNPEKVKEGITNDNIFDLLAEELTEGRDHFHTRVSPDMPNRDNLFDRAVVDVMIKQAGTANKFGPINHAFCYELS